MAAAPGRGGWSGSRGEAAADRQTDGKPAGPDGRRAEEGGGGGSSPRAAAMAQCVQSVQEFIQDSFVPLVAALCSEEAEKLTRKNNLSFAELVKPFCRLTSEGQCRERSRGAGFVYTGRGRRRRSLPPGGPGAPPGCPERLSRRLLGAARLRRDPFPRTAVVSSRSGVTWSGDRLRGGAPLPGLHQVAVKSVLFIYLLVYFRSVLLCGGLEVRLLMETSQHTAEKKGVCKSSSSLIFLSLKRLHCYLLPAYCCRFSWISQPC